MDNLGVAVGPDQVLAHHSCRNSSPNAEKELVFTQFLFHRFVALRLNPQQPDQSFQTRETNAASTGVWKRWFE